MPATSLQPTNTGLAMVDFMTGVDASGTLTADNGWTWNGNSVTPGYDSANGSAHFWGRGAKITWGTDSSPTWTSAVLQAVQNAFAIWSAVANVSFEQVGYDSAQVKLNRVPDPVADANSNYDAGTPGSTTIPVTTEGFVRLSTTESHGALDTYSNGGYGPATITHELGHILGLMHTGTYNGDIVSSRDQFAPEDTTAGSIMSYIPPTDTTAKFYQPGTNWIANGIDWSAQTPMQYDILAIQRLYGPATSGPLQGGQVFGFNTNTGLDLYDFTKLTTPVVTLWDAGTNNTLDLSGFARDSRVDLNPGASSDAAGLTKNIEIAFGTRIDTALGGAGDDSFNLNLDGDTVDGGGGVNTVLMPGTMAQYTFGFANNAVTATPLAAAAGGVDMLRNVQSMRFSDGTTVAAAALPRRFDYTDTTANSSGTADGNGYSGPVNYLTWQYIWSGADGVNVVATAPSAFLHGGAGADALQVSAGSNVLDGGAGSNFLTGSLGMDGGVDTFFVDAHGGGTTWSTIANFHAGDMATLWGFTPGVSTYQWVAGQGAADHTGATLQAITTGTGAVNASFTFAGLSMDDASKLTMTTGSVGGNSYLFMQRMA